MDIQHLVDRLEDLIDEGRHLPFSKFTLIDEERALEIIDQMRISIPEEIEKAARVLAQRDRILAQANEEAARLVQLARERGEQMVDREAMVQAAQNRAANIIEAARQEAESITEDADQYVLETLSNLEQQLAKMLSVVRNGIMQVHSQSEAVSVKPATPTVQNDFAPAVRQPVEVTPRTSERD
ncbi:MAG: ATP synthase F0 subunit B [Aggregatilineales bacterium]